MNSDKIIRKLEDIEIPDKKKINMTDNDIQKLKEDLSKFNASKLIAEALNSDKIYQNESNTNKKSDDLLEQIKSNAIANFVIDLDIKNKNKIKDNFITEIDKFKNNAELAINRKEKISSEYISKYNKILEENKLLQKKLYDINNQYYSLEKQLKNSQSQIFKMQMRFGIFEKNKKLFEEFLNHFPNDDPLEIMKGYEQRHTSSINVMNENEELKLKIKNMKKQSMLDNEENTKHINKLYNKIDLLNKEKNMIIEDYELKISKLKNQINQIKNLEEKNKLLHKMLYQIYNKLIEAFRLDKSIRIDDEYLNIKEEDFKPKIFDDMEVGKYIELMIATTKPYTCDKLLRETIAYSNMILRAHLKKKINLRFDPVNTFKELKLILEEKEDKIKKLSELVKIYESKLVNQDNKNKKLSNIIEHIKKEKYNKINTKYMESPRTSSTGYNKKKYKKSSSNNFIGSDETINTKLFNEENKSIDQGKKLINSYDSKNDQIFKERITEFNSTNNKIIRPQTSFNNISKNKNIKIYHCRKLNNIDNIKYRLLSADNKQKKNKNNMNIIQKLKFYKDPLYQTLYSMNKNALIYGTSISDTNINKNNKEDFKNLKKIENSKNRDKILKKHGNQGLITYINEFNQLINSTNRLFLYKTRISPIKSNSSSFNIKNIKKFFKKEKISVENKLKSKIIGKINGLINNLEMKNELGKREESSDKEKEIDI